MRKKWFRGEMYDNDFGGAGSDDWSFVEENADMLSSVELVVGNSTVSSILKIIHSRSFYLSDFEKTKRS